MKRRDLSMEKYGISKEKYRELMYFCMQYDSMKKSVEYGLRSIAGGGSAGRKTDRSQTESQAMRNEKYIQEIRMIEDAAREADGELYPYILKAVTSGTSYDYMDVPAGRRKFYEARRKFFYILSKRR